MPQNIPFDLSVPGGKALKYPATQTYDLSKIRSSGPPIKNPCGEISVGPPQPLPVLTQSSFDDLYKEYKKKYHNLLSENSTRNTTQERHALIDDWCLICRKHGVPYKHL